MTHHSATTRAEIDQLLEATLAALRAPSILNSQPWRWRPRGRDVELLLDPSRRLPGVDPTGHLMLISCGVALHHATVALAAAGYAAEVALLPTDGGADVVARLSLGAATTPDRTAYDALHRRRTDRRPFADEPPAGEDLDELVAAARRHGVRLHLLPADQVPQFADIVTLANVAEREVPAYTRDVAEWSDRTRTSGDGVSLADVAAPGSYQVPPRDFALRRRPGLEPGHGTDRGTVYAVLVTSGQDRGNWLAAGTALSDVWLTLTARGLVASPISEVVEVPQAQAALRRLLGWAGHPAIALRIGLPGDPEPPPASARRTGTEVIGLPGDP
ncbi:Acg family FMN-binding oxidoreductase [Virgisporangium ochraceum]|uniref:NAD(P)H nitroreductase n=1 Tax=Virgisporangium ochraceum TaxID=65505 RepID=A0A8J4A2C1_9ACTN|nr:nitroreductase family protein [Virgisporangium ochraceum]GIJ71511.1 NAD(P)H nitroreductase [Virgisporangium ochraceum]